MVLVAATACGGDGDDDDVLAQVEEQLAELQSGEMALALTASTGAGEDEAGPLGFRVEGPFSFDSGGDLPVFDLTYTRLLDEEEELRVGSDGEQAWVIAGGEVTDVPAGQLDALRLGEGGAAPDLDLAGWVGEAAFTEDGDEVVITGDLDVLELLQDLQRLVAEVEGQAGDEGAEIDDESADRLRSLVRSSDVEIVADADSHRLRSLRATVDFGGDTPPELQEALGAYAAARLELTLTLEELSDDLNVERPSS